MGKSFHERTFKLAFGIPIPAFMASAASHMRAIVNCASGAWPCVYNLAGRGSFIHIPGGSCWPLARSPPQPAKGEFSSGLPCNFNDSAQTWVYKTFDLVAAVEVMMPWLAGLPLASGVLLEGKDHQGLPDPAIAASKTSVPSALSNVVLILVLVFL